VPEATILEKHHHFIVVAKHRITGQVMVWSGFLGMMRVESGAPAQLVNEQTANELRQHIAGSSSDREFSIMIIPVRDPAGLIGKGEKPRMVS
jgi:hypothetical protein